MILNLMIRITKPFVVLLVMSGTTLSARADSR